MIGDDEQYEAQSDSRVVRRFRLVPLRGGSVLVNQNVLRPTYPSAVFPVCDDVDEPNVVTDLG